MSDLSVLLGVRIFGCQRFAVLKIDDFEIENICPTTNLGVEYRILGNLGVKDLCHKLGCQILGNLGVKELKNVLFKAIFGVNSAAFSDQLCGFLPGADCSGWSV